VITTMLVGLVTVVITGGLLSVQRSEATVRGRATSLDELRDTLGLVGRDVRQAVSIDPSSTASHLQLEGYDKGARATIVWEVNGDGDLQRSVDGGAPTLSQEGVLDPDVFSFLPDVNTTEVVFIDLTLQPRALPETELTVEGEVRLRNRGTS
jgi:type II secretory pathway component PulJ